MLYNFCKSRQEELIFAHLNVGALFGDNLSKQQKLENMLFRTFLLLFLLSKQNVSPPGFRMVRTKQCQQSKLEDKLELNSDSTVIISTFATKIRLKLRNCFTFDFPKKNIATTEPPVPNLFG